MTSKWVDELAPGGPPKSRELGQWFQRHRIRSATALHAAAARAFQHERLTLRQWNDRLRMKFPSRARRGLGGAAPAELSRTYVLTLRTTTQRETQAVLARLRADPGVEYAEPDLTRTAQFIPNDPFYSSSGTWQQTYGDQWGPQHLGCSEAWDNARGTGVIVAVIDTGVDAHADVVNRLWHNAAEIPGNNFDDDHNGFVDDDQGWDFVGAASYAPVADNHPDDVHGHGTHVAGIIVAEANNGTGIAGVAWEARVMAVKALDDSGTGSDGGLAAAILYAVDNGADVINASWGGRGDSQTLQAAVEYAYAHGVLFVAAAGNSAADLAGFHPANVAAGLAVSAFDPNDAKARFSNFGTRIGLGAPGVDILSLRAEGTSLGSPIQERYTRASGTSMAAPHVAGVAALVLSRQPSWSVEQLRQVLYTSAVDVGTVGWDRESGAGLVNAQNAVAVAGGMAPLKARILSPANGTSLLETTNITGVASGLNFDHYVLDYASSTNPKGWVIIANGATAVESGVLASFDPGDLADVLHTLRLRVFDAGGRIFEDRMDFTADTAAITEPSPAFGFNLTVGYKPGIHLPIYGRALGRSFKQFRVEWAGGSNPLFGWRNDGVTLVGNGSSRVENGLLATWDTHPITAAGYFSIRLVVEGTNFTSTDQCLIYLEPDLLSTNWPQVMDVGPAWQMGVLPALDGSNRVHLIVGGFDPFRTDSVRAKFWDFSADGSSVSSFNLSRGSYQQPAVGQVDGARGEEAVQAGNSVMLVVPFGNQPRPFGAELLEDFIFAMPVLADLDDDGRNEVLTWGRRGNLVNILAWRPDGRLFSAKYPIAYPDVNWSSEGSGRNKLLVLDWDHDGSKQLLMIHGLSEESFTFRLYDRDGTPRPTTFPAYANRFMRWIAADVDHDGHWNLVLAYAEAGVPKVALLGPDGAILPGWPVSFPAVGEAAISGLVIGDLDLDGIDEIVLQSYSEMTVLRTDGTPLNSAWPKRNRFFGPPVIGDINGDGTPELVASEFLNGVANLRAINPYGIVVRSWLLTGMQGAWADPLQVPLLGDFNQDGYLDIAVTGPLVFGATVEQGTLRVYQTDRPYDPDDIPWPMTTLNPQNNAVKNPITPRLRAGRGDGYVGLSWPATSGLFTLETADRLLPPAWRPYPGEVSTVNGRRTASINVSNAPLFFRLRGQ